ncbi:MAG: hypothetical protein ACO1QR_05895 [Chthoniobacteraceae bacterium]
MALHRTHARLRVQGRVAEWDRRSRAGVALKREQETYERLASGMRNSGYGDEQVVNTTSNVAVLQRPLGPTSDTGCRDVLMGALVGLRPLLGLVVGRWRSGSAGGDRVGSGS